METTLIRGAEADLLLADATFLEQWRGLEAVCPWATPFQSPAFARVWYREYRSEFDPLLLLYINDAGRLEGLLPLAVWVRDSAIVPVGGYQAEYQGWICTPELAGTFPLAALAKVRAAFPRAAVRFKYLPPGIRWERPVPDEPVKLYVIRKHRRPLLRFGDGREIEHSLKKSGNKSRLRQLKKKGAIEFKRVDNPSEFDAALDEIVRCHDARHLEAHGFAEFQREIHKRDFTRALMNEPGLLHITTLTVGGQLASAQINYINGKQVQFGLIAHDPAFAHYSPGKLHILFLARMLLQEGYEQIDLTPGGEEYKERFANGGDDVFGLIVYPTPIRRTIGMASMALRDFAKRTIKTLRFNATRFRATVRRASRRFAALRTAAVWLGAIRTGTHLHRRSNAPADT